MAVLMAVLLVLVLIAIIVCLALALAKPERSERALKDNHRAMARWIDHAVEDDDVRPLMPEEAVRLAKTLLVDYYREDPEN